jgi:hypothetical protein
MFEATPAGRARPLPSEPPSREEGGGRAAEPGAQDGAQGGTQGGTQGAEEQGGSTERKLLEVLSSLDLNDLPAEPEPLRLDAENALATLQRGHWLRLIGRGDGPAYVKVAWINARRTVVLMVRHPDRRALSMRASELLDRFRQGRAARIR